MEQWNDSSWHAYNSPFLYYFPNDLGNDIQAVTCGGGPLAAFQSSLLNNCSGSATINFYNTSSNGANSVSWSFTGGTPSTSTAANPVVSYASAGTYTFQEVAYGASSNDTLTSTVNVYPAVTASTHTTPATGAGVGDGTATVTGLTGTNPFSYYWFIGNGDTAATVTGLTPGTYYVEVTDNDGCYIQDSAEVGVNTGVISVGGAVSMQVYPSPATDVLNIKWGSATKAALTITDMSGKALQQYNVDNSISSALDISSLTAGAYMLTISDASGRALQSVRFVKL
ncbi:unnamed protein product [Sphagnum jensenii]|uniref:PKD domain-containing protein n=1 Tax=Sphagnum jensenii TaxID=128206 RepID=A0ABP0VC86_9BRYO